MNGPFCCDAIIVLKTEWRKGIEESTGRGLYSGLIVSSKKKNTGEGQSRNEMIFST